MVVVVVYVAAHTTQHREPGLHKCTTRHNRNDHPREREIRARVGFRDFGRRTQTTNDQLPEAQPFLCPFANSNAVQTPPRCSNDTFVSPSLTTCHPSLSRTASPRPCLCLPLKANQRPPSPFVLPVPPIPPALRLFGPLLANASPGHKDNNKACYRGFPPTLAHIS